MRRLQSDTAVKVLRCLAKDTRILAKRAQASLEQAMEAAVESAFQAQVDIPGE